MQTIPLNASENLAIAKYDAETILFDNYSEKGKRPPMLREIHKIRRIQVFLF